MDPAVVVIRNIEAEALKHHLGCVLPGQSEPWLIREKDGPVAFVNLAPAKDSDLESQELDELERRLGSKQLLAVLVDVSVRNVGCTEVRGFVSDVLENFSGLASDDLREHWWTVEEINSQSLVSGHILWPHETIPSGGSQ